LLHSSHIREDIIMQPKMIFCSFILLALGGCTGDPGEPGAPGAKGDPGAPGSDGAPGDEGDKGDAGAGSSARDAVDKIPLFGENFFPEGIAIRADGTLYVGSALTGEIVRIAPGLAKAE